MKWLKGLLIACAIVALVAVGFPAWLLSTASGVRFAMDAVSRLTSANIAAARVKGSLAGGLALDQLSVRLPDVTVIATSIHLSWSPAGLLQGRIEIDNLTAKSVNILNRNLAKKEPLGLTWPVVRGLPLRVEAGIGRLKIDGLSYGRSGEEPMVVDSIAGRVVWQGGRLAARDLEVRTPRAGVTGQVTAGFTERAPFLDSALSFRPSAAAGQIRIQTALRRAKGPGQLAGTLSATGEVRGTPVEMNASVETFPHRLRIRHLTVMPGKKAGHIAVEGEVRLVQPATRFSADVTIAGLDLAAIGLTPAILSGKLSAAGTTEGFSGDFSLENVAEDWRAFHASGALRGSTTGATVHELKADWLGGTVTGQTRIDWKQGVDGSARLIARGLDPELIDKTWAGNVNADLRLQVSRTLDGETVAAVQGRLLKSTFRGRPVTGTVDARTARGEVRLEELDLHGRGFDVTAGGVLSNRISFKADVRDLSALVPEGKGAVGATGWLRYRDSKAAAAVQGRGKDIAYDGASAASFRLSAGFDQAGDQRIALQAAVRDISFRGSKIGHLATSASGRIGSHDIHLSLSSDGTLVEAAVSGGYGDDAWKGELRRLQGADARRGNWSLVEPARLAISPQRVTVAPFRLSGGNAEFFSGRADLGLRPLEGLLRASWQLDASRVNPFISGTVTGRSEGQTEVTLRKGSLAALTGQTAFSGNVRYEQAAFPISEGRVEAGWTAKGLEGSWQVVMGPEGSLRGTFASPATPRFALPDKGRMTVAWRDLRLGLINPLLRGLSLAGSTTGNGSAELLLGDRFLARLDMSVTDGVVRAMVEGRETVLPLRTVSASADWREEGLKGRLGVDAGQKGAVDSDFFLPIPARTPLAVAEAGRVSVSARVRLADVGLLSPFFPEPIRDPQGRIEAGLDVSGTWQRPAFDGNFRLADGGVRFPSVDLKLSGINASGTAAWDVGGLRVAFNSDFAGRGTLTAAAASPAPPRMKLPDSGHVTARWDNMDLALVSSLMPQGIRTDGRISGTAAVNLSSGQRLTASMRTNLNDARVGFVREGQGIVRLAIETARIGVNWEGDTLTGDGTLRMTEYGQVKTSFSLPIPAHLPVRPVPSAPVEASLTGQLREQGLVSTLLPGLVEETKGRLAFDIGVGGIWSEPLLHGNANLSDAGAYLPRAGIHVRNLSSTVELSGDTIRVVSLRAESGSGYVKATGQARLVGWNIAGYQASLSGERFQAVYLPELRLRVTPDFAIQGNAEEVSVRGGILVPQLLVYGPPTVDVVRESPDVIIMDAQAKEEGKPSLRLAATIKVTLGDDVQVKMRGIDAKLAGSAAVKVAGMDDITANGQINVVKGNYSAYGVDLKVTRGQIALAGPPDQAGLNILAVREIENASLEEQGSGQVSTTPLTQTGPVTTGVTRAESATSGETRTGALAVGVQITGTVSKPVIDLYSRPPLQDAQVLSYIVFGKPLGGDVAQTGVLMQAAGSLLSRGNSESFQDKIKRTLGLESLRIGTTTQGGTESTMISVGKYLSPGLYVNFGRSLFTGDYAANLRYRLSKSWEIRTTTGGESGGDIYYKIEFD